jgi:hypothetical protein
MPPGPATLHPERPRARAAPRSVLLALRLDLLALRGQPRLLRAQSAEVCCCRRLRLSARARPRASPSFVRHHGTGSSGRARRRARPPSSAPPSCATSAAPRPALWTDRAGRADLPSARPARFESRIGRQHCRIGFGRVHTHSMVSTLSMLGADLALARRVVEKTDGLHDHPKRCEIHPRRRDCLARRIDPYN